MDPRSGATGFVGRTLICQNLTKLSGDDEMRVEGEENAREVRFLVCLAIVLMCWDLNW